MTLGAPIPALPVRDVAVAARHYVARFGFEALHQEPTFAVLVRDDARLHLWQADDEGWALRPVDDLRASPVRTGAESFLAGTASCRIAVDGVDAVDELHVELSATGVLHPAATDGPHDTEFGTREFATVDLDGNLLEFFVWRT